MAAPTNVYVDPAIAGNSGTGTIGDPYGDLQYALNTKVRDATNGDQFNIKAGTAEILAASLALTTYGTPAETAPLVFRGYTAAANDGGIGEIDANGATLLAATGSYQVWADMEIHNFGNNNGITANSNSNLFYRCEIHKGASTPSGKVLLTTGSVIGCYIHDAGATGTGIICNNLLDSYIYNCPTGSTTTSNIINNVFVDCDAPIVHNGDQRLTIGNSIYSSTARTGTGINAGTAATTTWGVCYNNIIEGYSGVGGKGIASSGDLAFLGYNAFYNNSTPKSLLDVWLDLGNDATLLASPFTSAAGGDFSLKTTVVGAIDGAFPGTWYGPAATTDHADIGAVQNGAGTGGAVSISPLRGGL